MNRGISKGLVWGIIIGMLLLVQAIWACTPCGPCYSGTSPDCEWQCGSGVCCNGSCCDGECCNGSCCAGTCCNDSCCYTSQCLTCKNDSCQSRCIAANCETCQDGSCEGCDSSQCLTCVDGSCEGCDSDECESCVDGECKVCGGDPNLTCCEGSCCDQRLCHECVDGQCQSRCGQCKICDYKGDCVVNPIYDCAVDSDCIPPQHCENCMCVGGCDPDGGDLCTYTLPYATGVCSHPLDDYACDDPGAICWHEVTSGPTNNAECIVPGCDTVTGYCVDYRSWECYNKYVYIGPGFGFFCACDGEQVYPWGSSTGTKIYCNE